jgi:heat-inducible transcriptional repressor
VQEQEAQIQLSDRQEQLLSLIVRSFTESQEPVASNHLVKAYDLPVSSATVRNDMSRLEELGLIVAPHTSAGRIPTVMGYRYFVRSLMNTSTLTLAEQNHIMSSFERTPKAVEQWLNHAATVLARTTRNASLVTSPVAETSRFKHLEMIAIQGNLILLVLVMRTGSVHQQMFTLGDTLSQEALSEASDRLNGLYAGLSAQQIRVKSLQLPVLEQEVSELVIDIMQHADRSRIRIVYSDGLSEVVASFPDTETAQHALRLLEQRAVLEMIITELLSTMVEQADASDVGVVVGGDRWEVMDNLSMIVARYGYPGELSGTLGVLGPLHQRYGRSISAVRFVAHVMTDRLGMLVENRGESAPPG